MAGVRDLDESREHSRRFVSSVFDDLTPLVAHTSPSRRSSADSRIHLTQVGKDSGATARLSRAIRNARRCDDYRDAELDSLESTAGTSAYTQNSAPSRRCSERGSLSEG